MYKKTLPFASIGAEEPNNDSLKDTDKLKLAGTATMPPQIGKTVDPFGVRKFCEDNNSGLVLRQNSILSFQNLSIGDCTSVGDSQFSHYNPSINEPFVSEDADPEEKEMHRFLDLAGVF